MSLFEENAEKIKELASDKQWAAMSFMRAAWDEGKMFKITETHRTFARQLALWKIGRRGIPGEEKRTWTLNSLHLTGQAMDLYPYGMTTHRDLERLASMYGISHPLPTRDPPHYVLRHAVQAPTAYSPQAQIKRLQHRVTRLLKHAKYAAANLVYNTIERMRDRMS